MHLYKKIIDHHIQSKKQYTEKQITVIKKFVGIILCSSSMTLRLKYHIKNHK